MSGRFPTGLTRSSPITADSNRVERRRFPRRNSNGRLVSLLPASSPVLARNRRRHCRRDASPPARCLSRQLREHLQARGLQQRHRRRSLALRHRASRLAHGSADRRPDGGSLTIGATLTAGVVYYLSGTARRHSPGRRQHDRRLSRCARHCDFHDRSQDGHSGSRRRALMDAGKLDRRVTLQRQGVATDDGFQSVPGAFADLADVWAQFIPLTATERAQAGETQPTPKPATAFARIRCGPTSTRRTGWLTGARSTSRR
jgi:hypothetical protein